MKTATKRKISKAKSLSKLHIMPNGYIAIPEKRRYILSKTR
jgi:hypothetical protein